MSRVEPDVLEAIKFGTQAEHDTLYCNEKCKQRILNAIDGASAFRQTDNVTVLGLDVQTHEAFVVPISCKKGDIFPLAEDYKENNDAR